MSFLRELSLLREYIEEKGLRHSKQREKILTIFLEIHKHVTVEEVYEAVKERLSTVGIATIYRSLNLFCDCGLSRMIKLTDGVTRYEAALGTKHHDHLICTECGRFIEITNAKLEELQEEIAREFGFTVTSHRHELYGICKECQKKKEKHL